MVQIKVPPTLAKIASWWVNNPLEVFKRICELNVWVFNKYKALRFNLIGFNDR